MENKNLLTELLIKEKIKTDWFFIPEKRMRPVGIFPLSVSVYVWKEERERKWAHCDCVCMCVRVCVCVCERASVWVIVCVWANVCVAVKFKQERERKGCKSHPKQSKMYKVYEYYGNPNEWSNEKD